MLSSASVQNFSKKKCFISKGQQILVRVLRQNHCDVILQSISTKVCIFICNAKKHLCAKFEQNWTKNKEVAKIGNDVISKNSSTIFLCE